MNSFFKEYYSKMLRFFLITFGVFAIVWVFYIKFIRERIFRDIPFTLTEFWFYALIFIISMYFYAMKTIIKPKEPNELLRAMFQYFAMPFALLDQKLKLNKYTIKYNSTILKYIVPEYHEGQTIFYVTAHLIPRTIILSVFLTDVFWYNHLEKFYYFLLLGIFPICYNYHKFSMYHAKEISLKMLESLYSDVIILEKGCDDPRITYEYDDDNNLIEIPMELPWEPNPRNKYHETNVTVREYFDISLEKVVDEALNDYELFTNDGEYGKDYYEFDPRPLPQDFRYSELKKVLGKTKLNHDDYEFLRKEFYEMAPPLVNLYHHLRCLSNLEKRYYTSYINFLIYASYFIGWSYILYKSFHSLTDIPLTLNMLNFMRIRLENLNPFIDS